jgi:hypothetical protein
MLNSTATTSLSRPKRIDNRPEAAADGRAVPDHARTRSASAAPPDRRLVSSK